MADSGTPKRIQNRLNRIKRLFAHLALTLLITLAIIYGVDHRWIALQTEDALIPVVVLLFIAHALWVMYREAGDFITQQEIRRAESDDAFDEKPKRLLALDDDGELTEIMDDDMVWNEKVKHSE